MNNSFYNKHLKHYAKTNRKKQTPAESILWYRLRSKQLLSTKFYRQRPINNYIVDFFAPEIMLIIEIDGSSHDESKFDYDVERQKELANLGFIFLRFTEYQVTRRLDEVLETIYLSVESLLLTSSQEEEPKAKS